MQTADFIRQQIEASLPVAHFELMNDSAKHRGHASSPNTGQSHFSLLIVSSAFAGKNRVARERTIHKLLEGAWDKGLHALSLKLLTPEEFSGHPY